MKVDRGGFPDGICGLRWTQADPLKRTVGLGKELGDDLAQPPDAEARASRLALAVLHDKRRLLVVDDVWDAVHLEPMCVGGPERRPWRRRVNADRRRWARPDDLDVLKPRPALVLLEELGRRECRRGRRCRGIGDAVSGHLPLALTLAGAQIQDGETWAGFCLGCSFATRRGQK